MTQREDDEQTRGMLGARSSRCAADARRIRLERIERMSTLDRVRLALRVGRRQRRLRSALSRQDDE